MPTNGMSSFSMDASKPKDTPAFRALATTRPAFRAFAREEALALPRLDPETAAKNHLEQALDSSAVAKLTRPAVGYAQSEFKSLGTEAMALTDSTVVKFRQYLNKIPVYGSLVVVELDKENECLAINSSLGTPTGVNHIAALAPADALAVAAKEAGASAKGLSQTPRLNYYFDQNTNKWRLVYIIESVRSVGKKLASAASAVKTYVVDAHTGKLVAGLPRIASVSSTESALDGLNQIRSIQVEKVGTAKRHLHNRDLNLTTYDFGFKDPSRQSSKLPGSLCVIPPTPWTKAAVDAHANGAVVLAFLRDVLKRNSIDNRGGEVVGSVNCWDHGDWDKNTEPEKQWCNAYWNEEQMVYGQVQFSDGFRSIASLIDIVAHEMFHGVTQNSCNLLYQTQSGALNESYSDIFGVIVANYDKPRRQWAWKLGKGFFGPMTYLRNMANPPEFDQPKKMADYIRRGPPYTENNDYGEVHLNSGIHNWVAYKIMTSKADGEYLFSPSDLARIFYLALTVHLTATSTFSDSRRAVLLASRSLFRGQPSLAAKEKAVARSFTAVGIA